jgi:glycosyltransferase involved in cell wall biosynthesis
MKKTTPLLSIVCVTYNHEKYISDAIESFLMQQTSFPYEIIIHDDASTDGTADIIKKYEKKHPTRIRTIYQSKNQYSQGINLVEPLFKMARGKYIALCEGDDYWIDPQKLQKQVDFMTAHPECSISCHKVLFKYESNEEKNHVFPGINGNTIFTKEEFYGRYIAATCSIVFQNKYIDELFKHSRKAISGDVKLFYFFATKGAVGYLDELMGVYRLHDQSMYYPLDVPQKDFAVFKSFVNIKWYFKIWGYKKLDKKILDYAFKVLEDLKNQGKYKDMRKVLFQSLIAAPAFNKKTFKQYFHYIKSAFSPSKQFAQN